MRMKLLGIVLGSSTALAVSLSQAHHGTSITYFVDETITLNGKVTEFLLNYPHPQIYFDVVDEAGNVQHWGTELGPTPRMLRDRAADIYSWSRTSMKPGDDITITCNPHKKPGATACLAKQIIINGKLLPLDDEQAERLRQAQ